MASMVMSRYAQIQLLHKCRLVLSLFYVSNVIITICLMYGQVIQPKELVVHNDAPPYEATSSHSDDPTKVHHGNTTL